MMMSSDAGETNLFRFFSEPPGNNSVVDCEADKGEGYCSCDERERVFGIHENGGKEKPDDGSRIEAGWQRIVQEHAVAAIADKLIGECWELALRAVGLTRFRYHQCAVPHVVYRPSVLHDFDSTQVFHGDSLLATFASFRVFERTREGFRFSWRWSEGRGLGLGNASGRAGT